MKAIHDSGLTAVYVDDMITPSAPPQAVSQFLTTDNWILTMGDFVGCVDEVRISKTIR